jgi:hypothetical protein
MAKVLEKEAVVKFNTHVLCSIIFPPENRAVYEIMWKNMAEEGKLNTTKTGMRIACWVTKARINTHIQYT